MNPSERKSGIGYWIGFTAAMLVVHAFGAALVLGIVFDYASTHQQTADLDSDGRYTADLAVYGAMLPGEVTDAVFRGNPGGYTLNECEPAMAAKLLSPTLKWDPEANRTWLLNVEVKPDAELSQVDWDAVNDITERLYGVHIVESNTTGIPILLRDRTTYEVAQIGKSATPQEPEHPGPYEYGRVDTNRIGYLDDDGNLVAWGDSYQVVVFGTDFEDMPYVLSHELGHAFGLAHIKNSGQVMFGTTEDGRGIGLHDCHRLILSHVVQ